MIEYPAMIYKLNRNGTYMANCLVKNIMGFGKTEEDAINNLKQTLHNLVEIDVNIKPLYGISMTK